MLISKFVDVKIGGRNISHYRDLGYDADENWLKIISVKIEDLMETSHAKVDVICDYCGNMFTQEYRKHVSTMSNQTTKKDCCLNCINKKTSETTFFLYGVRNPFQKKESQEKQKQTLMERYGVENTLQIKEVIEKIKIANENRTPEEKLLIRIKKENTCLERYGVKSTLEIKKCRDNLFISKNTFSTQQKKIFDIILKKFSSENTFINYTETPFSLDIALFINDVKLDIEYDSWYWHNEKIDRRRDEVLKNRGYRILRIKSGKKIPDENILFSEIEKIIYGERKFSEIILDDWNSEYYKTKREDRIYERVCDN